jgi:alpha-galactosidase
LAALDRTNINTQLLTIKAAMTGKKEHIYQAAMLDPHTSAELSIDDIVAMCDELIEAHGDWLPEFK